jgi:hypothetical protein
LLDRLVGGVGLRRGRRDRYRLYVGETVDFWRVEERAPYEMLRLRAEMRLPGLAWLELAIAERPGDRDGTRRVVFRQRALFHPRGLLGHLYWWSVAPFHGIVFGAMLRNIARHAERLEKAERPDEAERPDGRVGAAATSPPLPPVPATANPPVIKQFLTDRFRRAAAGRFSRGDARTGT